MLRINKHKTVQTEKITIYYFYLYFTIYLNIPVKLLAFFKCLARFQSQLNVFQLSILLISHNLLLLSHNLSSYIKNAELKEPVTRKNSL